MSVIQQADIQKIGDAALEVEKDINEAVGELTILKVSASKNALSNAFLAKKLDDIIQILER